MAKGAHVNHEPGRWSRTARPQRTVPPELTPTGDAVAPQQLHLVSQGYPVRIRRALVAAGLALALAVGGSLAASLASGSAAPTSEQSDAGVSSTAGLGS
jgi:hypothetical protein